MTKTKSKFPSEAEEQEKLFQWTFMSKNKYPEVQFLFAIPNGGSRHLLEAVRLKAQGVKRGVPDMCLPVSRGGFHALYIELKKQKGGVVSKEQKEWISTLNELGNKAMVCKGFEEAKKTIVEYLALQD